MILYQDQIVPESEVRISLRDRGYYFGDGIYEVFRLYNGILFERDAHLARLERSTAAVRIPLPCTLEELGSRLERLATASGVTNGTLYMQITRGEAPRTHAFPANTQPVLTGWCTELNRPLETMDSGITAVTLDDIRWHRCDLKTLNLLPSVLAKQEALDRGAEDAILHRSGVVTECTASNVMIVKNGAIYTHPLDHYILHGITRAVICQLSAQEGIPFHEQSFTLEDLRNADEVFLTGTTTEVTPIVKIDDQPVGIVGKPGPVTRRLQRSFEQYAGLS